MPVEWLAVGLTLAMTPPEPPAAPAPNSVTMEFLEYLAGPEGQIRAEDSAWLFDDKSADTAPATQPPRHVRPETTR